jgi:hypothetical protein
MNFKQIKTTTEIERLVGLIQEIWPEVFIPVRDPDTCEDSEQGLIYAIFFCLVSTNIYSSMLKW